ncbi:MAG TPA: DotU family type IV/VI secretion system protein, partial [Victivallales bacterium]|nr:DotU family type IV/VI secretion system protein [Victivallales bacterium]
RILSDIEHKVSQDRILSLQYHMIKLPLVFFTDSMISESKISFADQWDSERMAYEYAEMTGDHKFFKILDEIFEDRVQTQKECLYIFYTCIGLGFKGIYKNNPKKLQQIMWKLADNIPEALTQNPEFIIENDCHESREAGKIPFFITFWRPKTFIIVVVLLLFVWIISNMFLYIRATEKANTAFKNVQIEQLIVSKKQPQSTLNDFSGSINPKVKAKGADYIKNRGANYINRIAN